MAERGLGGQGCGSQLVHLLAFILLRLQGKNHNTNHDPRLCVWTRDLSVLYKDLMPKALFSYMDLLKSVRRKGV